MTPGIADRSCWILLQQLLAIGDSERALQLLNAHIEVEEEGLLDASETCVRYILQQLALLIKATPRYTQNAWASFEDFMSARKQWVTSVTMLADELPVCSPATPAANASASRTPNAIARVFIPSFQLRLLHPHKPHAESDSKGV